MNDIKRIRIFNAFKCSLRGFKFAFEDEKSFRQELLLVFVLVPLIFFVGKDETQKILLFLPLIILLITELLNSAVEASIDRIGKEIHPLSKKAKDLGSAAVFLSLFLLIIIWGIVIYNNFFKILISA